MQKIILVWVINKLHHRSSSPHHLPHLLPPSLPVCPSPPSAPFYAQNKSERTRLVQKPGETIDNSLGHHGIWICTVVTCAPDCEIQVNDLWTRLSIHSPKVSAGFNVANRGFRRSVFHLKVGFRNSRTGCQRRLTCDFQIVLLLELMSVSYSYSNAGGDPTLHVCVCFFFYARVKKENTMKSQWPCYLINYDLGFGLVMKTNRRRLVVLPVGFHMVIQLLRLSDDYRDIRLKLCYAK